MGQKERGLAEGDAVGERLFQASQCHSVSSFRGASSKQISDASPARFSKQSQLSVCSSDCFTKSSDFLPQTSDFYEQLLLQTEWFFLSKSSDSTKSRNFVKLLNLFSEV